MTALRRVNVSKFSGLAAALALAISAPTLAQNSDAPVDVTAAPPPSAETVGPSQLRDFNLQGTVTRPAETPSTTPGQPADVAPAAPRSGATGPAPATASPSPLSQNSTPQTRAPAGPTAPTRNGVAAAAPSGPVTPPTPVEVSTDATPQPTFDGSASPIASPADPAGGFFSWPWLAVLFALVGGAILVGWNRRSRRTRYGDPGRMAFAGPVPEVAPEARPLPPVRPRADPIPPRAQPAPTPAPRPDPAPRAAPKPVDDGLVVSTRFKPELNIQFVPDRVVVTPTDAVLQFDIVITNSGSAPARDVLVEARMFTAHAAQDRDIAAFFHQPAGTGDRIPAVAPLGKLSLKSAVRMPIEQLNSFEANGRQLFVPMVGFNILFRSSGGEGQASASFLVGRGNEEDEKLAPFRLDLGPRIFRGLSARPHSLGLQPA